MEVPDSLSGIAAGPPAVEPASGAARRRRWRRQQIAEWWARAASRRDLARFNEHMLRDIGVDPAERWHEARKRFWQP